MCAAGSQSWLVMRVLERMFCAELCAIREETRRPQGDLYVLRCTFDELNKKAWSRSHAGYTRPLPENLGSRYHLLPCPQSTQSLYYTCMAY
jgi:hypothetical protein